MPVSTTYPGVYVQEVPSGVRTIAGVATSVAAFIGRSGRGPLDTPVLCLNYSDFERTFSADTSVGEMAHQIKLFFLNGGTQCYVVRIADGATPASVTLQNEGGTGVLLLEAKQAGLAGESLRTAVTYSGAQPEMTFNLEVFISVLNGAGIRSRSQTEQWNNLSMDPNSPRYAPDFISQNSQLVNATESGGAPAAQAGFSLSGRPVPYSTALGDEDSLNTAFAALMGTTAGSNNFRLWADGQGPADVNLSDIDFANDISLTDPNQTISDLQTEISNRVGTAVTNAGMAGMTVTVTLEAGPTPLPAEGTHTVMLRLQSANGDVVLAPAGNGDLAVPLMLGSAQGGLEVGAHANRRPAPSGITYAVDQANLITLAGIDQDDLASVNFTDLGVITSATPALVGERLYRDNNPGSLNGNSDGVRAHLGLLRAAVNDQAAATPQNFRYRAEVWGYRLAILHTLDEANQVTNVTTATTNISGDFTENATLYSLGPGGTSGLQTPGGPASDGNPPQLIDYERAFGIIDSQVDLFNLMVLPEDANPAVPMNQVWGPASVFCQNRRAFLLMDAPAAWNNVQAAAAGVNGLRAGLVNDHAGIFYPRITVNDKGLNRNIGPTGAIAGLMARIDGTRGVWKAPAGTEAGLRGVIGLEHRFSDAENGVLNPRAINTIRIFPNGIVNWGARTMDGENDFGSEWKYVPVRRLALFMEESLYRGLKWAVFEPNDEPLWSQIRLNVGAFMHNLFRQGAFQGSKPKDAYFVKCDSETTTQNDIDLGIVNIWIGFAPLKPAEFVVLYLQQMAGQIET